ncbi:MAG: ATP-binding cassette domain-containing protein [Firmicutes bacterium]|nr:ATP-binding cassette domain-containing protein [Bacillota bacterium]MBQ6663424.1 ATP-binding cassette domain-containing protein [Bacillota bacterium]
MNEPILKLDHVSRTFKIESKKLFTPPDLLKAVQDVSLEVSPGEILGLVGESGCGKSTLGRLMIRLLKPSSGRVFYRGQDITDLSEKELRPYRKQMQIVFQDPYASLNPRMTVEEIIMDAMEVQGLYQSTQERKAKVYQLMEECGLDPDYAKRYPHEFSGGQRQRIGVARALSVEPEIMICDEPVSALDVSVQAQIINLLKDLKARKNLTLIFISHDLSVVNHIADRIAVMYLGQIVELAETEELFAYPLHPYTQALFNAIPKIGAGRFDPEKEILEGNIPSPIHLPVGCAFQGRCVQCADICRREGALPLRELRPNHFCACLQAGQDL